MIDVFASAERVEALCDALPDAILIVDDAGRIAFANRHVEAIFGYEPADLEGEPVEVLVPADRRETHVEDREAYQAAPTRRPMGAGLDLAGVRRDGSRVPVDIALSPVEIEGETYTIAAVRDVSEADRIRTKYRTLLDTAPDAVLVADVETGELLEANRRAATLLETEVSRLVGSHQLDLHPSDEADRYRALFEHHVDSAEAVLSHHPDGEPIHVETATGDRVPVEINARVVELDDRRVIIGVFRDLTERRTYERELEREVERLELVARTISHDLRNPLNVVSGRLDLARETGDLSHLEAAERALGRMNDLIEGIIALIREGEGVEPTDPLDLEAVVRRCWSSIAAADASLEFEVAEPVTFLADERRVAHVFENLFHNAVEHGGDDVTVRVGRLEDGDGLYVEDDGPGIPPADRDRVFEAGYTTREDGTGFGLNIVEQIAEAHGWTVRAVEAAGPDGGARFELRGVTFVDAEAAESDPDGDDGDRPSGPGSVTASGVEAQEGPQNGPAPSG